MKIQNKRAISRLHFENGCRNLLKCKRSQGHVEMVLSFAIFIGFIGVLMFLLNPMKSSQVSYTVLDMTEKTLMDEWNINYTTVSFTIPEGTSIIGSCFSIENKPDIDGNLIVKDQYGNLKNAKGGNPIYIEYTGGRYYLLYFSDAFSETPVSGCSVTDGEFGALNLHESVLYENIESFETEYKNDYDGLKKRLGINNDFMFFVYDESAQTTLFKGEVFVPKYVEIVARDIPITAIKKNTDTINLIVNIRAW